MKKILVIGTFDTKVDELNFLTEVIHQQGAIPVKMDVSVLGETEVAVDIDKHQVVRSANQTIEQIIAFNDENKAFQVMAAGAASLALQLYKGGKMDGMIALGGTMGTDLALEVAMALPIGVPKYIVSTVSFSPLIAVERLAPDVQMILWAGGLYGLNPICKATLSQAAGAVVGAAKAVQAANFDKPMVGITSLGKSALTYMTNLVPALEQRGFCVAVFHSTGLGGRTFETLCQQGYFRCVMDLCLQELINGINGSAVASGADRLTNAALHGIPQIVAPGATNIIDIVAHQSLPAHLQGRESHAHNRLIESVLATADERRQLVEAIFQRLKQASKAPYQFVLPVNGVIEWDRQGEDLYNLDTLTAFNEAVLKQKKQGGAVKVIPAHINDAAFVDAVLDIFDDWLEKGIVNKTLNKQFNDHKFGLVGSSQKTTSA